jgi:hypothetical protein
MYLFSYGIVHVVVFTITPSELGKWCSIPCLKRVYSVFVSVDVLKTPRDLSLDL